MAVFPVRMSAGLKALTALTGLGLASWWATGSIGTANGVPGPDEDGAWFHETWAAGDKSHKANGIRWAGVNSSPSDRPPLVTSVNPAPGRTHSLQFEFGGSSNPAADAFSEQRFVLGNNPSELWICWDLYLPGPLDRGKGTAAFFQRTPKGPGNNKLLRLWDGEYEKRQIIAGLSFMPKPGRPGVAQVTVEYIYPGPGGRTERKTNFGPWAVIFHPGTQGRWNRMGFHARLASAPFANDGLIEVTMNGEVLGRYANLPFRSHRPDARNHFSNGYLLGWANSGYNETTRLWIGDVIIGPERPKGC